MASRYPFQSPAPGEFRREKFRTKSTLRDYLVYGLVLVGLGALVGAGVDFFNRPPREKERLRESFIAFFTPKPEPMEIRVASRKAPDLDELDGRETAAKTPPPPPAKTPLPKPDAATAYAGGGPNRVLPSDRDSAVTMQSEGSYRGDLAAPFSGSLPAKYSPSIPWSFTSEIRSPSHPATLPPIAWLRLRHSCLWF